jgi:hypothetical protein
VVSIPEQPRALHRMRPGRQTGQFHIVRDAYCGTSSNGRHWLISPSLAGWRLEFLDQGDTELTYAGTHATLEAAKREARW